MEGPFGGMENIGRFPAGMNMGRMSGRLWLCVSCCLPWQGSLLPKTSSQFYGNNLGFFQLCPQVSRGFWAAQTQWFIDGTLQGLFRNILALSSAQSLPCVWCKFCFSLGLWAPETTIEWSGGNHKNLPVLSIFKMIPVVKCSLRGHKTSCKLLPFLFAEMDRAMGGGFEREFGRNEMGMSRSFGETLERGIGKCSMWNPFPACFCELNCSQKLWGCYR